MNEQDTEIVYVPGAVNHYKYSHDVIVLDERLKDYPKAHEYIKKHELEHAKHGKPENRGLIDLLKFEFRNDLAYYFSDSEEVNEVRDYLEKTKSENRLSRFTSLKFSLADSIRSLWDAILGLIQPLYWGFKQ